MKVTVEKAPLLDALQYAKKIIDKKAAIPVLRHSLLETKEDRILLTSTDMEHTLSDSIPAKIDVPGQLAIPTHVLSDIILKISTKTLISLSVDADKNRLVITADRSKFQIPYLPFEDFPKNGVQNFTHQFKIHGEGFLNLLSHTSFAASSEETRYHLQGVYFHSDVSDSEEGQPADSQFCSAATDGHRLACYRIPSPEGADNLPGFILSSKTCDVLTKLLQKKHEMVEVSLSDSQIRFHFEDLDFLARLVDAEFPDYKSVIPMENPFIIDVETESFKQALERVTAVCDSRPSAVSFKASDNKLSLTTANKEYGSADDVLDIDYSGSDVIVGFNHAYLKDVTDKIQTKATFNIGDETSAVVIRDHDDKNALYVLMPMRL